MNAHIKYHLVVLCFLCAYANMVMCKHKPWNQLFRLNFKRLLCFVWGLCGVD